MRTNMLIGGVLYAACLLAQNPPEAPAAKPAKPEDKCSVEGNVYSLKTGEPLKKADVRLHKGEAQDYRIFGAITDGAGHFRFENLTPGSYSLTASLNGYVTTAYGSKRNQGDGSMITLTAGAKMRGLTLKLPQQGVVNGRVIDEEGTTMEGVAIAILRRGFQKGRRSLAWQGMGHTNDKGEYRVYGIAPGRYYAVATARSPMRYTPEVRYAPKDEPSYPPTYYPNALTISDAAQIEILSGAELAGIDFRLVRTRAFKISGRLVGAAVGRISDIQISPAGAEGGPWWDGARHAYTDENGNFLFQDLRPGRYFVSAYVESPNGVKTAQAYVVIAGTDIEGLQLSAAANHELPGSVRVEGASGWNKPGAHIYLETEDGMRMAAAPIKMDGTFHFESAPLERVRVFVQPPDGYIKSVLAGGRDVEGTLLDFSEGVPGELSITLSPKAATVTGKVKDEKDQPATNGLVALVPAVRKRTDLYLQGALDQNGTYSIKNVPPGSYKIFAFDQVEFGAYQDPDWLKPFEEKGEAIEVKESESSTKDLKLIVTEEGE
jgi:protocatechuate 3,4-dioxygenase beta subunit